MFQKHKLALRDSPKWMKDNVQYEVLMGSHAYGVHIKESDHDIYGFVIPPKDILFPHQICGHIEGFGKRPQGFDQFQKCYDDVDFSFFNIVKYFDLCLHNNPNVIDSLFVPDGCVIHMTKVGELVRKNRKIFLCSKAWHTYKGYAYSQMRKLKNKDPNSGKRKDLIEKYGYDTKFSYHIVRLLDYAEQILQFGEIDLQRDKECWKSIRAGEWTIEQIEQHFYQKEKYLEGLYENTKLPHDMQEEPVKELLLNCLEHHYGSLDKMVPRANKAELVLRDLQLLLEKYTT